MRVILVQNVKNVGNKGDVVNVSDGYANNYLLKNKFAVKASEANLKTNEKEKALEAKRIKEETDRAKEVKAQLEKIVVNLSVQVGENGKAFGSISQKEIADELNKMGYEIDRKKIDLESPIKTAGNFKVPVKLYKGVVGNINVCVKAEKK